MDKFEFLAEYFEQMDELVYISDPVRYEILYMNKQLRESLGYMQAEEYRGKKCYQVLQGLDRPCDFCTNQKLAPGRHVSWVHKNPLLDKRFLVKDTLFCSGGQSYRVEVALDIDSETIGRTPYYYARSENLLNECLQKVFTLTDPGQAVQSILDFIGRTFDCDRVYVFEMDDDTASNTYEWCREGVSPQKEILQQVPLSDMQSWMELFREKKSVSIPNVEAIRTLYPTVYAILKPQQVQRLTAAPIVVENRVIGFVGVDNPCREMMEIVSALLKTTSYFILSLLKRRDLLERLSQLSFRDMLTGAYNRNALFERYAGCWNGRSLGVMFCDVTGLKQTNDTLGHDAGDELLRRCCAIIRAALDSEWIFRSGGDEFVAVFENLEQQQFEERAQKLRAGVQQSGCHIAVGCAWSDQAPLKLEELIGRADAAMYEDKRRYYEANRLVPGIDRRAPNRMPAPARSNSPFYQFIRSTYCDMELFFNAAAQQNTTSYFYFGDMQKNMFYISDNMRDEFGFEGNIVPGLLQEWGKRIATPRARALYRQELESMLREKRSVHDLRYQVRRVDGKTLWIRCYGVLKWNEDRSLPLFFSGRVTHQDEEFVVDPTTNFPREGTLLRRLDVVREKGEATLAIGFALNRIADLNNTRGRAYTDGLIRGIAEELVESLGDKMNFYRLEGMRCLALVDPGCKEPQDLLVAQIRAIVANRYRITGTSVQQPCAFGLMYYPQPGMIPADFLEQMAALIKTGKQEPYLPYAEYSDAVTARTRRLANMALALSHDVLHGMEHFRVVVQPVVESKDGEIHGGETLLRWQFEGRDVPPDLFIPMLEKGGMIHTAGRWTLEQAVLACLRLCAYDPEFYLTFNVSLHQMSDEGLPAFMEQILAKYQLDGSHLVAEVTESCMDEQPEKLLQFVQLCEDKGVRIALDDFGNGYSSFRRLLQYPSSIVKLDRSLLREMGESDDKMNFISSIVYACHRFGKRVCMEGVETADQDKMIREAGCDMIQGFYHYRPMELEQLYRLLAACPKSE